MQINQNNYNTKRGFFVIPFTAKIQIWILFTVCHFFIIWPWEFGIKLNNIHKLMLFCILDTFLKDNVLILEGEITNWSLLGVKELENAAKMIVGSSCLICVYNTFVVLSCYTIHVKWRTETSVHSYPCNFFFFFYLCAYFQLNQNFYILQNSSSVDTEFVHSWLWWIALALGKNNYLSV